MPVAPRAGQRLWITLCLPVWVASSPPSAREGTSGPERLPCLAVHLQSTAHHLSQPQFPFLTETWHCWMPQCPLCQSSASGTFPAEPDWAPPSLSIFLPRELSLGKGKELLMQNKWNQSKQKATGLILFITHPRVSNASPDIHSHMERGNPAGPPWWAGTGRASHDESFTLLCPSTRPGAPPSRCQPHCLAPSACSLGLHQSPASPCSGLVARSSPGTWSGGG